MTAASNSAPVMAEGVPVVNDDAGKAVMTT